MTSRRAFLLGASSLVACAPVARALVPRAAIAFTTAPQSPFLTDRYLERKLMAWLESLDPKVWETHHEPA